MFSVADAAQVATDIADFGADLFAVGFIIDLFRISRSLRREWTRDAEQQELVEKLREDGRSCADAVALGIKSHTGALSGLQTACTELDKLVAALSKQQTASTSESTKITARLTAYQEIITDAHRRLGAADVRKGNGNAGK